MFALSKPNIGLTVLQPSADALAVFIFLFKKGYGCVVVGYQEP